jgi:hypothetical protein
MEESAVDTSGADSNHTYEFRFRMTMEWFSIGVLRWRACNAIARGRKPAARQRRGQRGTWVVIGIALLMSLIFVLGGDLVVAYAPAVLIGFVGAIVLLAVTLRLFLLIPIYRTRNHRSFRKHANFNMDVTVWLSREGLSTQDKLSVEQFAWASMAGTALFTDGILFQLEGRKFIWLPAAALVAGDLEGARQLIRMHNSKLLEIRS